MSKKDRVVVRLGQLVVEFPNGSMLGLSNFEIVKRGWIVPLPGATNFTGEDGLPQALALASRTSKVVCGWESEDQIFWDVVEVFEDEEIATFAGRKFGALFIYQIETGRIKWMN